MDKLWVIYKIDGNTGRETMYLTRFFDEYNANKQVELLNNRTLDINKYYAKPFVAVEEESG